MFGDQKFNELSAISNEKLESIIQKKEAEGFDYIDQHLYDDSPVNEIKKQYDSDGREVELVLITPEIEIATGSHPGKSYLVFKKR